MMTNDELPRIGQIKEDIAWYENHGTLNTVRAAKYMRFTLACIEAGITEDALKGAKGMFQVSAGISYERLYKNEGYACEAAADHKTLYKPVLVIPLQEKPNEAN